nr:Mu transposase C-terminal domain-containing protein [Mucilaginibacter sp. L294]
MEEIIPVHHVKKTVSDLTDDQWQLALKRYQIIAPIINNEPQITVAGIARNSGFDRRTIYRWIEKYTLTQTVSSLVDAKRTGGEGLSRIAELTEDILTATINERYLTNQKLTAKKISIEVALKCREAGLNCPHYNTVRNRINQIGEEQKLAKRQHNSIARNKYKPIDGNFPGADYPLAVVQIDHTPMDIIVVDEVYREPVGKPYITMAIDVYSRMVVGFYISLDPPGALGTGMCLSNAILPKELWLAELDVTGKWPCHGLMKSIHLDNAPEFRGKMLERACQEYGIEINFRPVATPHYGGHIERLLGTVLREVHALPGTTFSNVKDRKYYDSEGKACFTMKELEQWLAIYIVNVYHQKTHSGIGTSPHTRYMQGITGNDKQIGIGQSDPIENELKLKLDFMPFVERTIQRYGVVIDHVSYYHDVLRKWVHAYENPNARHKVLRKFAFKQDPRDISAIYFWEPDLEQYFMIPYRNTGHPAMTIWEYRRIVRDLNTQGVAMINEDIIFDAYDRLRWIEDNATTITAAARRQRNRARKQQAIKRSIKNQFSEDGAAVLETDFKYDPNEIYLPFEDLEHDPFNRNKAIY